MIHRFWLQALGMDGDYARFPVAPQDLGAAVRALPALGMAGVNVTLPHKVAVMEHLEAVDETARAIGAVNTVVCDGRRLLGTNTDMAGFLEPLAPAPLGHAVVIGAGGAARAVLLGLKSLGVEHVTLMNRSVDRAGALLDALEIPGHAVGLETPLPSADLVVNASSLGMAGQPPLDPDLGALPVGATVYDIVYAPLETRLLARARAGGFGCIDGMEMLIGQAAMAFALFFGVKPPRDQDAALRALLTGDGSPLQGKKSG